MLALVIVVDLRTRRNDPGDALEFGVGHLHRRQRGRADRPRPEYRAHAAHRAFRDEPIEHRQDGRLVDPQVARNDRERRRHERKSGLVVVEQARLERGQRARHVRSPSARRAP